MTTNGARVLRGAVVVSGGVTMQFTDTVIVVQ